MEFSASCQCSGSGGLYQWLLCAPWRSSPSCLNSERLVCGHRVRMLRILHLGAPRNRKAHCSWRATRCGYGMCRTRATPATMPAAAVLEADSYCQRAAPQQRLVRVYAHNRRVAHGVKAASTAAHAFAWYCLQSRHATSCYDVALRVGAAPALARMLVLGDGKASGAAVASSLALGSLLTLRASEHEGMLRACIGLRVPVRINALLGGTPVGVSGDGTSSADTALVIVASSFLAHKFKFVALACCPTASLFTRHGGEVFTGMPHEQLQRFGAMQLRAVSELLRGADERLVSGAGFSLVMLLPGKGRESCASGLVQSVLEVWERRRDPRRHALRALREGTGARAPLELPRDAWQLSAYQSVNGTSLELPLYVLTSKSAFRRAGGMRLCSTLADPAMAREMSLYPFWRMANNVQHQHEQESGDRRPPRALEDMLQHVVRYASLGAMHSRAPCEELDHELLATLFVILPALCQSTALASTLELLGPSLATDTMALARCSVRARTGGVRRGISMQSTAAGAAVALLGDREANAGEGVALSADLVTLVVDSVETAGAGGSGSGTSFATCLQSLARLSVSDSNKSFLNAQRVLDICVAVLRLDTTLPGSSTLRGVERDFIKWTRPTQDRCAVACAETIFQLAVSNVTFAAIHAHSSCVQVIRHHATKATHRAWPPRVRECCAGAMVALEKSPTSILPASTGTQKVRRAKHIMVSYQWDHQLVVIRVVNALKQRGFAVWFDLEAMSGSTLDAMAEAIEGACCALVCMSAAYKKSANCRLEGNYIHNVGLPWVPLLLEQGYVATGCTPRSLVVPPPHLVRVAVAHFVTHVTCGERGAGIADVPARTGLGIMLGNRLYFKVDSEALAGEGSFGRRMDEVVLEVQRRAPHSGHRARVKAPGATPGAVAALEVSAAIAAPRTASEVGAGFDAEQAGKLVGHLQGDVGPIATKAQRQSGMRSDALAHARSYVTLSAHSVDNTRVQNLRNSKNTTNNTNIVNQLNF